MFNFIVGAVAGAVAAVAIPAVYAFVAKQVASIKSKV
jgi:hypothetical protein